MKGRLQQKLLTYILSFIFLFTFIVPYNVHGVASAADPISIEINSQEISFDTAPMIKNSRVLVPLRGVFEALDADVTWFEISKTIVAEKAGQIIVLQINNEIAKINDKTVMLDAPPQIIDHRTMVPTRFIAESLGAKVTWEAATKTVKIDTQNSTIIELPTTDEWIQSDKPFSFRGISLGDSQTEVEAKLANPKRVVKSEYGFDWHIYHNEYKDYLQIGISESKVVGVYTNSDQWVSKNGIQIGQSPQDVRRIMGSAMDGIKKGNTFFRYNIEDTGVERYDHESFYSTLFYDTTEDHELTAIQLISYETEQSLVSFYGSSSTTLGSSFELQSIDLANAIRVRKGLPAFKWDDSIAGTARKHSKDMYERNYFDHTNLDGLTPFDRMKADGISYRAAGENIARGQSNAIMVHEAWMNSPGHRSNILGDFERLGVGVHFGDDDVPHYTQNFYTPR